MSLTIPDDILQSAKMTEEELKLEIAILLYQQKKISIAKARFFAGKNVLQFQKELANRGISLDYEPEDQQADIETLRRLGQW